MPNIHLHYFAMLREARGQRQEAREVPDGTTVEELYCQLFPVHFKNGLRVAYAVNEKYAQGSTTLIDGDTVAFIPPVGGG